MRRWIELVNIFFGILLVNILLVRFIKSDRTPCYKNTHDSSFGIILGEPVPHLITRTIRLSPPRTRIIVYVIYISQINPENHLQALSLCPIKKNEY